MFHECSESELIAEKTFESIGQAIKFFGLLIVYYGISMVISYLDNTIASIIYWILVVGTYSSYAAGMWMRAQEVTQEAIKMEMNFYQNRSFVGYQIDESEPLQQLEHMMTRIIFGILFQLQSNFVCSLIGNYLPFPLYLLKIPIYSLFISIQNISAKIPYKAHLAYYYMQNVGYLIGLNFLFSCYLHISSFPFFTGLLWLVMPIYLLNAIPREPPSQVEQYTWKKALLEPESQIVRDSYMQHLEVFVSPKQKYFKDPEYTDKCDNSISYISLPTILVPYAQTLLSKAVSLLQGHQHQD